VSDWWLRPMMSATASFIQLALTPLRMLLG
jgi:hypothetical protein